MEEKTQPSLILNQYDIDQLKSINTGLMLFFINFFLYPLKPNPNQYEEI